MTRVKKAIFPVAGLGTRFLPATKTIPKEMLTLVDKPLIQYAIDEARKSGIEEFIFISSREKTSLINYFDCTPELERQLEKQKKFKLLEAVQNTALKSNEMICLQQRHPRGLGHAVRCAAKLIDKDEPFAVILPDDVIAAQKPCLKQMIDHYNDNSTSMVALMEVNNETISHYGVADIESQNDNLFKLSALIEKPTPQEAPSNLAIVGRYILSPHIMNNLAFTSYGAGGEIQLTDAIAQEFNYNRTINGYRFEGQRFDCGNKAGFLQATIAFGMAHNELGNEFCDFLNSVIRKPRVAA